MSLEKKNPECRRHSDIWKATPRASIKRDVHGLCVVEDPIHVQKLYARESGGPTINLGHVVGKVRDENPSGVQHRCTIVGSRTGP